MHPAVAWFCTAFGCVKLILFEKTEAPAAEKMFICYEQLCRNLCILKKEAAGTVCFPNFDFSEMLMDGCTHVELVFYVLLGSLLHVGVL